MSDEWDVFGSDDDESVTNEEGVGESQENLADAVFKKSIEKAANEVTQFITQTFIKSDRNVPLKERYFASDGDQSSSSHSLKYFNECLRMKIQQRGIKVEDPGSDAPLDSASLFQDFDTVVACTHGSSLRNRLVPGGLLMVTMKISSEPEVKSPSSLLNSWMTSEGNHVFDVGVWDLDHATIVYHDDEVFLYSICVKKRPCPVNTLSCKWKTNTKRVPESFRVDRRKDETWICYERRILSSATITLSAHEQKQGIMTIENMNKAVNALRVHGFVVLPRLFNQPKQIDTIKRWSKSFLKDFDSAADILLEGHGVDILNPGDGSDPLSYREMAMREDFRLDLRDGPTIRDMRGSEAPVDNESLDDLGFYCLDGGEGNNPSIIDVQKDRNTSQQNSSSLMGSNTDSLRFNPSVLEIARKLLNPNSGKVEDSHSQPLYKGNFGRWNFSGSGPNGQPQPLRVGQIGSVISLPGCADQCIHADTPHIFETEDCLPCHYANLFIYGDGGKNDTQSESQVKKYDLDGNFTGDNLVGGTAFIDGSHRLSVTARMTADDGISAAGNKEGTQNEMHMRIIRPSLQLGDAVIFDTRTLHFGLANLRESNTRRPILYVNMTHSWFFDPKNWDNKKSLFFSKEQTVNTNGKQTYSA